MIKSITLENLHPFKKKINVSFSKNINIVIGKEGDGKSNFISCINIFFLIKNLTKISESNILETIKHTSIMKCANSTLTSKITLNTSLGSCYIKFNKKNIIDYNNLEILKTIDSVFLPASNIMNLLPNDIKDLDLLSTIIDIDENSKNLIKQLSQPVKKAKIAKIPSLIKFMEAHKEAFLEDSIITSKNNKIKQYIKTKSAGEQKLLVFLYLWHIKVINNNTILLMDTPEAGLSPNLISKLKIFIKETSKTNIQSFITTHSYLLCTYLSLMSEYNKIDSNSIQFHSLYKTSKDERAIESSSLFDTLINNPILEEYANSYETHGKLFMNEDFDE